MRMTTSARAALSLAGTATSMRRRRRLGGRGGTASAPELTRMALAQIEWIASLFPIVPAVEARVTVMFTDIAGFTTAVASEGAGAAAVLLRRHDAAALPAIRRHMGRILKRLGDGLMVVFATPADALAAALAMQRAAAGRRPVRLRIGIHVGQARVRDGDLVGHDVNVASRIADRAPGGGILVSRAVRDGVDGGPLRFQRARPLVVAPGARVTVFRVHEPGVARNGRPARRRSRSR